MPGTMPTLVVNDNLIILRLEIISPATSALLFFHIEARYVAPNVWKPVFVNDRMFIDLPSVNLLSSNYFVHGSLANSNNLGQQTGRLVTNNVAGTYKVQLLQNEPWDVSTQKIVLKYFATNIISPNNLYFQGTVGRIDFVGGFYDGSASTTQNEITLQWMLPCRPNLIQTSVIG